ATLLAFTGTPLSRADANTREVFGAGKGYISVYDFKRAVDDGATVRVYHEPRLIPVSLPDDGLFADAFAVGDGVEVAPP
ncbi:hypothetical protein, partial [Nocardia sp.]|uniref:hypothetical protein n=1 Tax=Nocardia sp. TaxID=1821 RepID=UPI00258C9A3B